MSLIYLGIWSGGQSELNPAFPSQNFKYAVDTGLAAAVPIHLSIWVCLSNLPFAPTEVLPNILDSFKLLKSFFS